MNYFKAKEQWEADYTYRVLKAARGNVSQAAHLAGMNRNSFYELMKRTGVRAEEFRARQGFLNSVREWWRQNGS